MNRIVKNILMTLGFGLILLLLAAAINGLFLLIKYLVGDVVAVIIWAIIFISLVYIAIVDINDTKSKIKEIQEMKDEQNNV